MIYSAGQRGVVLVTTLVLLVVLTLVAASMLRTSVLELKIGGAHQVTVRNLNNAEAALQQFLNANRQNYAHGVGSLVGTNPGAFVPDVTVTPVVVYCADNAALGTENSAGNETLDVAIDVTAVAVDSVFDGRSVVHQGVRTTIAGGNC